MEKRIIIAFILSFAVLYGFSWLFPTQPVVPVTVPAQEQQPELSARSTPEEPVSTEAAEVQNPAVPSTGALPEGSPTEIRAEKLEDITIDTSLYTALLSNGGGSLRSFKLKGYTDAQGRPIELIHAASAGKDGWLLGIVSGDGKIDETLAEAPFAVTREGERTTMEFASGGLIARKVFAFRPDAFEFSLETSLSKDGRELPHSVVWQGGFGDQSIPHSPTHENVLLASGEGLDRTAIGSIEPGEITLSRIGVEDQYFLAMLMLPRDGLVKLDAKEYLGVDEKAVATAHIAVQAPQAGGIRVYIGPKDQRWLRQTDAELVRVIDYGFFEVITRPLIFALLWIHSYVGNFGWAIILLTLLINLALFPLRLKQQVSMQKMQKIQPMMRTLQDKYKKLKANDPKRAQVQQEMMGLYKEHGVNPMGGCLPLLLQMPFFFAFWNMLNVSIEMRQAPWLLWIRDLSQHDPYYILPILMALSMFFMQKMMPTTTDPAQAKIMLFMPLMFTFFFLWAQSGLVLYWLTSNVVGIGQQVFINRYWAPNAETKGSQRLEKKGPKPEQ